MIKILDKIQSMVTPVDPKDVLRLEDLGGKGGLDNIATILMGDSSTFSLANAFVFVPGSGYVVGDIVTVEPITGLTIDLPVIDVNASGGITNVSFPYINEPTDFATLGTPISCTGGTGTGATFILKTMYGVGLETIEGILSMVPSQDPLVQYSMLVGYVRDILKARFPIKTEDIADSAIVPDKIDDGTIFGGTGIQVIKTSSGIEISLDGASASEINVTFTNYDQDGNLIV